MSFVHFQLKTAIMFIDSEQRLKSRFNARLKFFRFLADQQIKIIDERKSIRKVKQEGIRAAIFSLQLEQFISIFFKIN